MKVRHPMAGRHGSRTLGQCGCPARSPKSMQAHQGAEIGAFFDLDGTLVAGFTGVLLTQHTFRRREIGIGEFLGVVQSAVNHQLGRADFEDLVHKCLMSAVSRWRVTLGDGRDGSGVGGCREMRADRVFGRHPSHRRPIAGRLSCAVSRPDPGEASSSERWVAPGGPWSLRASGDMPFPAGHATHRSVPTHRGFRDVTEQTLFPVRAPATSAKAWLLQEVLNRPASVERGPPPAPEPRRWGISMIVTGEFQRARSGCFHQRPVDPAIDTQQGRSK